MTSGRHRGLGPASIRRLTASTEPWMSCDDCFEDIDSYVDELLTGHGHIAPRLRVHLIGCGACLEEAWSLLLLAADEQQADPVRALARMRDQVDCAELAWPDPPTGPPPPGSTRW